MAYGITAKLDRNSIYDHTFNPDNLNRNAKLKCEKRDLLSVIEWVTFSIESNDHREYFTLLDIGTWNVVHSWTAPLVQFNEYNYRHISTYPIHLNLSFW